MKPFRSSVLNKPVSFLRLPVWKIRWAVSAVIITAAAHAAELTFTTGGDASWFPQTSVTHDGISAEQSGAITHSQESWIQTTVTGAGTLTFWWKVSSERSYDFLSIYINGTLRDRISGDADWNQCSVDLPDGENVIKWCYTKDYSDSGGQDTGWLDEVAFAPAPPEPQITAQPGSCTNVIGTEAFFEVTVTGNAPLIYQWQKAGTNLTNGGNISGADSRTLIISDVQFENAGEYYAIVSNAHGSVTSAVVTLTVIEAPEYDYVINWWDAVSITGYLGTNTAIEIPAVIEGFPVTAIASGTFSSYRDVFFTNLTSVVLPDSLMTIEQGAFSGCSGLTNVILGSAVSSIGDFAFSDCTSLENVLFPSSMTYFGSGAFSRSGLTNAVLSSNVLSVQYNSFSGCSNLAAISVSASNEYYSSLNGVLFDKERQTLMTYPGGKGGDYIVPGTVSYISPGAFSECQYLTAVTIPDQTQDIGMSAFSDCARLTNAVIGNGVTALGAYAFLNCKALTSLTLGNSLESIGFCSFQSCPLPRIQFPDSLVSIGEMAFSFCTNLPNVIIPNNVITIGGSAFANCGSVTNIFIGNAVTNIGDSAFAECTNLVHLYLGQSLLTIGANAFNGCYLLPNVAFPTNLTVIGDSAFQYCGLTSITIPGSVTCIGEMAFAQCYELTYAHLTNGLLTIDDSAFYECGKLTEMIVPDSVTYLGRGAFTWCNNLVSVVIGPNVTALHGYTFSECLKLKAVYFKGNAPSWESGEFDCWSSVIDATVYYLAGTEGWGSEFSAHPTALWQLETPVEIRIAAPKIQSGNFHFSVTGGSNQIVVLECCTNLIQGNWIPVQTNTLTGGSADFDDPLSTNHSKQFYRIKMP